MTADPAHNGFQLSSDTIQANFQTANLKKRLELVEFFGSASVDMSKFIVKMNVTFSTQTLSNGRNIFQFTISSLILDFSNDHLTF